MEKSFPFNAVTVDGVPDRVYAAEDFAAERAAYVSNGITSEEALAVTPGSGGGLTVDIAPGIAVIDGYTYRNTAALTLTVAAADAALPRIDLAVLRLDLDARGMQCALKTGTPANVPVAPTLTVSDTVHEIPLAEIAVAAAETVIESAHITDRRIKADYILNKLDIEETLARYETALEKYFGEADAAALAEAAAVIQTDAGADMVLCGDGTYRSAILDGDKKTELVRFTVSGVFSAADYPTQNGLYDIVLQGGGGSGAVASEENQSTGGGAAKSADSFGYGLDGGSTSFGPFTVPGGAGGVYGDKVQESVSVGSFTAEAGTAGSGGHGGDSLFAAGGMNNYSGVGGNGSLGSGGGAGYKLLGSSTSGAGGGGVVILYGVPAES